MPSLKGQQEPVNDIPVTWQSEDAAALPTFALTWQDQEVAEAEALVPQPWQIYPLGSHLVMLGKQCSLLLAGKLTTKMEMAVWKVDVRRALSYGFARYVTNISTCGERCLAWTENLAFDTVRLQYQLLLPELPPGCYAVTARHENIEAVTLIVVSNLGLLVKRDATTLLAWVAGRDGKWQPGATNLYLFQTQRLLHEGKTNTGGIWAARLADRYTPLTLLAVQGEHIAVAESTWYRYEHLAHRCHFYFSQATYAPGQTVQGYLVIRNWDYQERRYRWAAQGDYRLTLQDSTWRPLLNTTLTLSPYGTAVLQYPLSAQATPGKYSVRLSGAAKGEGYFTVTAAAAPAQTISETTPTNEPRWLLAPCPPVTDTATGHNYYVGDAMEVAIRANQTRTLVSYENDRLAGYAGCWPNREELHTTITTAMSPAFHMLHTWFAPDTLHHIALPVTARQPQQELRLYVTPDKSAYAAGEPMHVHISVKDWQNRPVQAEILLHMYAAEQQSVATLDIFYGGVHVNEVVTSDSYQFSFPHAGEFHALPWPASRLLPKENKSSPVPMRQTMPAPAGETALWQLIATDCEGEAKSVCVMPQNGCWRLVVLALDAQTRIGETNLLMQQKK
jgi:uncharacterized protein YfaS (alpha-2-macroglobulin family)